MSRGQSKLRPGILGLFCIALLSGCGPQLDPTEEGVLYYFRNARVHGGVRRLWPAGQRYVDGVLKADAAFGAELRRLTDLEDSFDAWLPENPDWQDEKLVADRFTQMLTALEGYRWQRELALEAFVDAVGNVPEELEQAATGGKDELIARVWTALAIDGDEAIQAVEEVAEAQMRLLRAAREAYGQLHSSRPGLHYRDADLQTEIHALHQEVARLLEAKTDARFARGQEELPDAERRMKLINRRERRYEHEYATAQRKFWRDTLEGLQKELRTTIESLEERGKTIEPQLADAADAERAKLEARLIFNQRRLEILKARREKADARVKVILAAADEAAAAAERELAKAQKP